MNNNKKRLFIFVILSILLTPLAFSQSSGVEDAMKKKEKTERSYKKAYKKARKKTIKHRMEIQTKETRKYMKSSDKRAKEFNKQGDQGFVKRLFSRKKKRK